MSKALEVQLNSIRSTIQTLLNAQVAINDQLEQVMRYEEELEYQYNITIQVEEEEANALRERQLAKYGLIEDIDAEQEAKWLLSVSHMLEPAPVTPPRSPHTPIQPDQKPSVRSYEQLSESELLLEQLCLGSGGTNGGGSGSRISSIPSSQTQPVTQSLPQSSSTSHESNLSSSSDQPPQPSLSSSSSYVEVKKSKINESVIPNTNISASNVSSSSNTESPAISNKPNNNPNNPIVSGSQCNDPTDLSKQPSEALSPALYPPVPHPSAADSDTAADIDPPINPQNPSNPTSSSSSSRDTCGPAPDNEVSFDQSHENSNSNQTQEQVGTNGRDSKSSNNNIIPNSNFPPIPAVELGELEKSIQTHQEIAMIETLVFSNFFKFYFNPTLF